MLSYITNYNEQTFRAVMEKLPNLLTSLALDLDQDNPYELNLALLKTIGNLVSLDCDLGVSLMLEDRF